MNVRLYLWQRLTAVLMLPLVLLHLATILYASRRGLSAADILGLTFDYPEKSVLGKRWVGEGPYRVWKNRLVGTTFGLHETTYSRSTPGVSYAYPEFEGFFGAWNWLEMHTRAADVIVRNSGSIPFFALYAPTPVEKPILELPDLGWSFLHAVPPIGTKFALPDVLGPQSRPAVFSSPIEGELSFTFTKKPVK